MYKRNVYVILLTIYVYYNYFVFGSNVSKSIANIKSSQIRIISPQFSLKSERLQGFKKTFFRAALNVYFYRILIMHFYV